MHDATVDPREVDYYSRLADTWWDESGPFWPLHKLNELRSEYISRRLSDRLDRNASAARPLDGLKILDVGCGGGILSESMASRGATVTGIDVVEKNIRVAELHARQRGLDIEYRLCPVADIAADEQNRFDVVLNMEVVEHVNDVPGFMRDYFGVAPKVELIDAAPALPHLPSLELMEKQRKREYQARLEEEAQSNPKIQALLREFGGTLRTVRPRDDGSSGDSGATLGS